MRFVLMLIFASSFSNLGLSQNICRGTWSYKEYDSCRHSQHPIDRSAPITETNGSKCGYAKKTQACWNGDQFSRDVTQSHYLKRRDHYWHDHELQSHCQSESTKLKISDQERVASITASTHSRERSCYKRDYKKKCVAWDNDVSFSCNFRINTKEFSAKENVCPKVDDISQPLSCTVGYQNQSQRSAHCPNSIKTTSQNFDAASLMNVTWRENFVCTTGDHLPESNANQINNKITFLLEGLESLNDDDQDQLHILDSLQKISTEQAKILTDSQLQTIEKYLDQKTKILDLDKGEILLASQNCVKRSDGLYWYCANSIVNLDRAIDPDIDTSMISFDHEISLLFQCQVQGEQAHINIAMGPNRTHIAPSKDYFEHRFSSRINGNYTAKLQTHLNQDNLVDANCIISVISNDYTINLDSITKLVRSKLENLNFMSGYLEDLGEMKVLPNQFSILDALIQQIERSNRRSVLSCSQLQNEAIYLLDKHGERLAELTGIQDDLSENRKFSG